MRFERLVALEIRDADAYSAYRAGMTPILHRYGGDFGYDFTVSETLKPDGFSASRVFTIHFPDEATSDAFFSDPEYVAVKEEFFEPSVAEARILSSYTRD